MSRKNIQGEPLAGGKAVGNLCVRTPGATGALALPETSGGGPAEESSRFRREASALVDELREAVSRLDAESMSAEADIVRAHVAMLEDPEFHRRVHESIREAQYAAEQAAERVLEEMADLVASVDDPAMAERAAVLLRGLRA